MIVKVTQEHIDKGKRIDCYHCPVALALLDVFKVKTVNVGAFDLRIGLFPDNLIFTVPTPSLVERFIYRFDEGRSVEPFEFELSLEGVKL
jgi:hypothetical protein